MVEKLPESIVISNLANPVNPVPIKTVIEAGTNTIETHPDYKTCGSTRKCNIGLDCCKPKTTDMWRNRSECEDAGRLWVSYINNDGRRISYCRSATNNTGDNFQNILKKCYK